MSETPAPEAPVPTALYHIFGDEELLLYIGISKDFGQRWKREAKEFAWWDERRRQTVLWYPSRPEAKEAEAAAIKTEKPKYNIVHNGAVAIRALRKAARGAGQAAPSERAWIPVRIPDRENAPASILDFPMLPGPRRPGVFTQAERTLSDVATVEAMLAGMPEMQRELTRMRIECWRLEHRHISVLWESLDELNALAGVYEDKPAVMTMLREVRAGIRRSLGLPCPCCDDAPPAGMRCQECGGEGPVYVLPQRRPLSIASRRERRMTASPGPGMDGRPLAQESGDITGSAA